jgi:hypothetical protein
MPPHDAGPHVYISDSLLRNVLYVNVLARMVADEHQFERCI